MAFGRCTDLSKRPTLCETLIACFAYLCLAIKTFYMNAACKITGWF